MINRFSLVVFMVIWHISCGGGGDQVSKDLEKDKGKDMAIDIIQEGYEDLQALDEMGSEEESSQEINEIEQCQGCLLWPCQENGDCLSNFCVETMTGFVCSAMCSSDNACPKGWKCVAVTMGTDIFNICIDPFPKLCQPCKVDIECVPSLAASQKKYMCIEYGAEGRFCGIECQGDDQCPEGFVCANVKTNIGEVKQCKSKSGVCECTPKYKEHGNVTICYKENQFGKCLGERTCDTPCNALEPKQEECNQEDDNCDGKIDNDVPSKECDLINAYGTCKGVTVCASGKEICDGPYAVPEVCNGKDDDCNGVTDDNFPDMDKDGIADCVDKDLDGDNVSNDKDNCPDVNNSDQSDIDSDGKGDVCDDDIDGDGKINMVDNCPKVANPDQTNTDGDEYGDVCDPDDDNDTIPDIKDNCPLVPNQDQQDMNKNGIGDLCDCDADSDGIPNWYEKYPDICPKPEKPDNCPFVPNPDQTDSNGNGVGDVCEWDVDADGIANEKDNCPEKFNPLQEDQDGDGVGDVCDIDADGDLILNENDNCPLVANPDQSDMDNDGEGDGCDKDIDGDGDPNETDCNPLNPLVGHTVAETCNGINDDCDDFIDEEGAVGCKDFFYDADKDGYGKDLSKCLCSPTGFYSAPKGGDCDDSDDKRNPGVQEICNNGKDDNCNGSENDENGLGCTKFYLDNDGDNWGTSDFKCLCYAIGDYKTKFSGDCDDNDPQVNPAQKEVCYDGKDNDCSGSQNDENALGAKPFYYDEDKDGYGTSQYKYYCVENPPFSATQMGDCNDNDPAVNPGAIEVCDGKDNNCDGKVDPEGQTSGCITYYYDEDGDGYGLNADSKCLCNPQGKYSATSPGDCNDKNASIKPGAPEICNGEDDNCNGSKDEGDPVALCGSQKVPHGTLACVGGKCIISSCESGWFDVNKFIADGCECQQDINDNSGNSCQNAINLGDMPDNGSVKTIEGRIVPDNDEDWYRFNAKDNVDTGTFSKPGYDQFHVRVRVVKPTDGTIGIAVYRGSCNNAAPCGTYTDYRWYTNHSGVVDGKFGGEKPCMTEGQKWNCCAGDCDEGAPGGMQNIQCCGGKSNVDKKCMSYCQDESATFYFKVYRIKGSASSCTNGDYIVEYSNGAYNP